MAKLLRSPVGFFCSINPVTWLRVNHVGGKAWLEGRGGNRWFGGQLMTWMNFKGQDNKCFLWNQRLWELDSRTQLGTPLPSFRMRQSARWDHRRCRLGVLGPSMRAGLFLFCSLLNPKQGVASSGCPINLGWLHDQCYFFLPCSYSGMCQKTNSRL